MTRNHRLVLLGLAAAVLVVAVLAIGTGGDDTNRTAAAPPAATGTPASGEPSAATPTPTPQPTPAPPPRIRVRGLQPIGGVKELEVQKGDRVRFVVTSDQEEAVHLHGYDIEEPVGPGQPASFDFKAANDGIYEIELENNAVEIASLRVNP